MTTDPIIEPDTKNWTWVLERPCPECGFDVSRVEAAATADTIPRLTTEWAAALDGPDVRRRPDPTVWSTLEYGCHVRDVFAIFDRRLERMLTEHHPQFENWDQDQTARDDDYGSQDPAIVRDALVANGTRLAARFDTVAGDQWQRRGTRSDGAEFTVESFALYLVHDPIHHLWDIGRA